jgi:hypothetical protein
VQSCSTSFDNRLLNIKKSLQISWKLCAANAFFTFSAEHFEKNSESLFEAFITYAKKQRVGKNIVKTLDF